MVMGFARYATTSARRITANIKWRISAEPYRARFEWEGEVILLVFLPDERLGISY